MALVSRCAKELASSTSLKPHLKGLSQLRLIFVLPPTPSNTLAGCNISSLSSFLLYMRRNGRPIRLFVCEDHTRVVASSGIQNRKDQRVVPWRGGKSDCLPTSGIGFGFPSRRISRRLSCLVFDDRFQEMRLPTAPTVHLRKRLLLVRRTK